MKMQIFPSRSKRTLAHLPVGEAAVTLEKPKLAFETSSDPRRSSLSQQQSTLEATVLSVQNHHRHGELYVEFLKARKRTFIDIKGWSLPNIDGMEFDQYDTPKAIP